MFCPNCGTQLPDDARFCGSCGAQITPVRQAAPQPQYRQAPQQQSQQAQPQYRQAQPQQAQPQYQQAQPQQAQPQYQQAQPQYQQTYPQYQQQYVSPPPRQFRTDRALWKMILLGLITFGIYPLVVMTKVTNELNTAASRYDGKSTMHYCLLVFLVAPITLGIAAIVWNHRISNRLGNELSRRGIPYSISASTFWLWGVLGTLILVGPFVYQHKLLKASNLINENYNIYG